jgi:drug/metabolite transporter (DMT)-like permease
LLAFGSACAYAMMAIVTRQINHGDHPITIAIYSLVIYVVFCLLSLVLISVTDIQAGIHPSMDFLVRDWIIPDQHDFVFLVCLGLVGTVGFYYIAKAYMIAPASHVAPFEYTYIIFVVVFSYLFFAEVPKSTTFLGIAILIISGLYIWHHDESS